MTTQATPTGDALLDDVLERLVAAADARPCAYWIKHVAKGSEAATAHSIACIAKAAAGLRGSGPG